MSEKPDTDFQVTKQQRAISGLSTSFDSLKKLIVVFIFGVVRRVGKIYPLPPEVDFNVTKNQSQIAATSLNVPISVFLVVTTVIGTFASFLRGFKRLIVEVAVGIESKFDRIMYLHRVATEVVGIIGSFDSLKRLVVVFVFGVVGQIQFLTKKPIVVIVSSEDSFDFLFNQIILEISGGIESVQDSSITKSLSTAVGKIYKVGKVYPLPPDVDFNVIKDQTQTAAGFIIVPTSVSLFADSIVATSANFLRGVNQLIGEVVVGVESVRDVGVTKILSDRVSVAIDRSMVVLTSPREELIGIFDGSNALKKIKQAIKEIVGITENTIFGISKDFSPLVGIRDTRVLTSILSFTENIGFESIFSRVITYGDIIIVSLVETVATIDTRVMGVRKLFAERVAATDSLFTQISEQLRRISKVGVNFISIVTRPFTELSIFDRLNEVTIQQAFNQTMIFERARYTQTKNIENNVDTFDPRNNVETFDEFNQS